MSNHFAAIEGELRNRAPAFKKIALRIIEPIPPDNPAAPTIPAPAPRAKIAFLVT
jgi:hypothetical protein